ncbi:hypothetical protein ACFOHT_04730 [Massilia oculi]|uniref:Uncharacterized protein n=2 Tax=Massilia oculi TaxID=945844 RepID=A0A2S2DE65_9BURK|nr:hypothetical protein DIR46_02205 [Massilia oculi]
MASTQTHDELYETELAKLIEQRVSERRAALVARDEAALKVVADELLEFLLEGCQFRELLAVVPTESQAVVGKRFANLLEQYLATEAHTWAKHEIKKVARANKEISIADRAHRYLDRLAAPV